jgi:DNA-binding Xre family transcriptional regulator
MDELLKLTINLTDEINVAQKNLDELRAQRRKNIIHLRENKVTARVLSDCLGMSEQNVHKIVKGK